TMVEPFLNHTHSVWFSFHKIKTAVRRLTLRKVLLLFSIRMIFNAHRNSIRNKYDYLCNYKIKLL
ncbi:hypothetical protein DV915_01490, partial [Staphylococcus aureus]